MDGQSNESASVEPVPGPVVAPSDAISLHPDSRLVVRGPRRRRLLVAVAAVALVATGVAVVVLSGDDEVDPDAALRAAQDVVEGADGYQFEQLSEIRVSTGDPDGSGTDTATRVLTTGTVAAPDRWHLVEDAGDMGFGAEGLPTTYETIRVGDEVFSTGLGFPGSSSPGWVATTVPSAPIEADLGEMWGELGFGEAGDPFYDEMRLELAMQAYLSDESGDPAAVTRVVTELTEPVVEEEQADGGVLLRARLAPVPALAELDDIPPVDVVLHLDADRRPVSVRFTAEAGSAAADVEVGFSHWGDAPAVEAPREADVDRTPWVSEEDLAALSPALLLAPTTVPAPFELVGATVYDEAGFFGGFPGELGEGDGALEPCLSLTLSYGSEASMVPPDPSDLGDLDELFEEFDYLDVSVRDPSCTPDELDLGPTFDDELGGLPASGGAGFWEVQVGDVVVGISSTLDDEVLGGIVASLQPTTAAALIDAIPEWVGEAGAMGGWFGVSSLGGMGLGFSFAWSTWSG